MSITAAASLELTATCGIFFDDDATAAAKTELKVAVGFANGSVKLLDGEGRELCVAQNHEGAVTHMQLHDGCLFTAADDGLVTKCAVERRRPEALAFAEMVQRLPGGVRTFHFANASSPHYALAGDTMDVCLANVTNVLELGQHEGHKQRIVCVRFDANAAFVGSLAYDGAFRVWQRVGETQLKAHSSVQIACRTARSREIPLEFSWSMPQPALAAVPAEDALLLVDRGAAAAPVVTRCGVKFAKNACVQRCIFSPDARFVCVCASTAEIAFWCVEGRRIFGQRFVAAESASIVAVSWSGNATVRFLFSDASQSAIDVEEEALAAMTIQAPADASDAKRAKRAIDVSDDEATMEELVERFARENSEADEDAQNASLSEEQTENDDDDEEAAAKAASEKQRNRHSVAQNYTHPIFMPGSTPFSGGTRFLCWNAVGTVVCRHDAERERIDVEFADNASTRPIRFANTEGFSIASLGEKGVVFAAEWYDDEHPACVRFMPYDSWALNSDWSISLASRDSVLLAAVALRFVLIFTANKRLAVYSLNGVLQADVFWPCRSVVGLVAMHSSALLLWTCDAGSVMFALLDVESLRVVHTGVVCAAADSPIMWAGFSELGVPLVMNEAGLLFGLLGGAFAAWTPLLDTRTQRSDRNEFFWPVAVTFDDVLLCVPCIGGSRFPTRSAAAGSRFTVELRLQPPTSAPLFGVERDAFLLRMMRDLHRRPTGVTMPDYVTEHVNGLDFSFDKALLEMFVAALNANKQARAVEFVISLTFEASFHKAVKVAQHLKFYDLADRIDEMRDRKFAAAQASIGNASQRESLQLCPEAHASQVLFATQSAGVVAGEGAENNAPNAVASKTHALLQSPQKIKSDIDAALAADSTPVSSASALSKTPGAFVLPKSKNPFNKFK